MRVEFAPDCDGDSFANVVTKLQGLSVEVVLNDRRSETDYVDGIVYGAGSDGFTVTLTDPTGEVLRYADGGAQRRHLLWENVEAVRYV